MKNKLIDLNNHLFLQLERVNEEGLKDDELAIEIRRSTAVSGLAKEIVSNASLALKAEKMKKDGHVGLVPEMLEDKSDA